MNAIENTLSTDVLIRGTLIALNQYHRKLTEKGYGEGWTIDEFRESAESWLNALHGRWEDV